MIDVKRVMRLTAVCAIVFVFVFLMIGSVLTMAQPVPEQTRNSLWGEGVMRVFISSDEWSLMGEALGRLEGEEHDRWYRSFTVGPYFRVFRNLRLGAFYVVRQGALHDDDWVRADSGWRWRDTESRTEHLFAGDATPRILLDFLPGGSWVGEIRTRYFYNTFDGEQTVTVRPGITCFWMRNGAPFISVYAQYEAYFPVNYGESLLYDQWYYLGMLYHLDSTIQVGINGAYRRIKWGTSDDFREARPADGAYSVTDSAFVIGLAVILQMSL